MSGERGKKIFPVPLIKGADAQNAVKLNRNGLDGKC
jgi:hypothetical protein